MAVRLLLAELGREFSRPSTWLLLTGFWLVVGLFALVAAEELQFYWLVVYTFLPLGMAPLAAHVVVRDRERGFAPLAAVTKLSQAHSLLAKALFLVAFLLAGILFTLPTTAVVVSLAGPKALVLSLQWPLWGLLLGLVSAAAGMLVGSVAVRQGSAALTAAFLLIITWVTIAETAREVVGFADSESMRDFLMALVHLSPVTWSYDVTDGLAHGIRAAPTSPNVAWGVAAVVIGMALVVPLIFLCLQHVDAWTLHTGRRNAALGLIVVVLLLGGGSLASAWDFQLSSERPVDRVESPDGTFVFDYQGLTRQSGAGGPWDFEDGDVVEVSLTIETQPGRQIDLRNVHLDSPYFRFKPLEEGPWKLTAPTEGPAAGRAMVKIPFQLEILYMATRSLITVSAEVEGFPMSVETPGPLGRSDVPIRPSLAVAAIPVAMALGAARFTSRRLNAW